MTPSARSGAKRSEMLGRCRSMMTRSVTWPHGVAIETSGSDLVILRESIRGHWTTCRAGAAGKQRRNEQLVWAWDRGPPSNERSWPPMDVCGGSVLSCEHPTQFIEPALRFRQVNASVASGAPPPPTCRRALLVGAVPFLPARVFRMLSRVAGSALSCHCTRGFGDQASGSIDHGPVVDMQNLHGMVFLVDPVDRPVAPPSRRTHPQERRTQCYAHRL